MSEGTAAPAGTRLSWLDALRGLAALAVVYWHLGRHAVLAPPPGTRAWLDIGKWGVVVFFLISGYIIPMSLERKGSLRAFWISRGFRLYPAWAVASLLMLGAMAVGLVATPPKLAGEPVTGVLAHATMLQGLLGVSNIVPVYWTLSYEMVFYLLVAGLFALGLHRHSAWYAAGLAGFAVLAAPWLPGALLTGGGPRRLVAAALLLVAVVAIVAGLCARRRPLVLAAAVAAVVGMTALLAVNGGEAAGRASWQSLVLVAVMFAGTTVYRMQHGTVRPAAGAAAIAAVLAAGVGGAYLHLDDPGARRIWVSTLLLSAATFAVAFLLRRLPVPPVLTWLGRLSYSVYLLHLVLLPVHVRLVRGILGRPLPERLAALAGFLLVLLTLAHLVYTYVEEPAQRLGRALARRADAPRRAPVKPGAAVGAEPPPDAEPSPGVPAARGTVRAAAGP